MIKRIDVVLALYLESTPLGKRNSSIKKNSIFYESTKKFIYKHGPYKIV